MTEHTHKVIRQDKINRLAKWRKGIKYTLGEKKSNAPGSVVVHRTVYNCLLYTSPSPRDRQKSRMPSSA